LELQGERHPNVIMASYGEELFIGSNRLVISKKEHDAYWSSEQGNLALTFYLNPFDNMVASFRKKLQVYETARNSDGIMLRMEESLPERGVALQQAIIQNYLLGMDEQRKDMAENAFDFIEGRLKLNHSDLDSLEIIMEEYRRSKDMVAPDKKIDYLYQGIKEFKTELSDAQTQLDIVEQLIASINQNKNELSVPNTALGVRDPLLNNLLARLAEKESEREQMRETVHQNNPLFKQLNNQIAELKTSMHDDLKSFGKNLRISVRDIESRIAEYEYEILQLSGNNRELDGLARKRDNMEELYNYLLKRREEAALVAAAELIDTWIIEKPHVESSFYKPRKSMVMIIGILLSLLAPATFIGYRNLFDRRIGSTNDLKGIKDMPVLSSVCNDAKSVFGISHDKGRINTREDFKALYFNLQFVAPDAKKILFTSIAENEGKTHCAINYGTTLAALGKRTCLVELDLRKPSFIDRLEISDTQGVLNMLDGSASLDDVLRRSTFSEDLSYISAGTSDQDPLKLLMSKNFPKLLDELAKRFDHVIIDTPPTMVSADIMVLSAHADLNIFVVREGFTPQSELKEIQEIHASHRIGNMALLLNGDSSKKPSSSYYRKTG
jgi:capsular exopolysaccharide synthesis family protein